MSKYRYEGYGVVRDTEIDFPYHTDDIVDLLEEKDQQITDLEAKLAESKKQCQECKHLNKKIELNIKNKLMNETQQLKQQLAEKEKENNELEFIVEEIEQFAWEQLNNDNFDKYKAYDEMYTKIKQLTKNSPYEEHNQDKISFAVEQLEKAKSFCISAEDNGWCVTHKNWLEIVEYIDNQIKAIKGREVV